MTAQRWSTPNRPRLLMLSHCLPCASGHADRARAWQLLATASASHDVDLMVAIDGPVRLDEWRAAYHRSVRMSIVTPPPGQSLIARCLTSGDPDARLLPGTRRKVRAAIEPWLEGNDYDAVLSTHPLLCEHAADQSAPLRVCDIHLSVTAGARRSETSRYRTGWIESRRRRRVRELEARIAAEWDIIAMGDRASLLQFAEHHTHSILLPEAVDLVGVRPADPQSAEVGRVVFHADWRHPGSRSELRAFQQDAWRHTLARHRNASLTSTRDARAREADDRLHIAQVAVTSPTAHTMPRWTFLMPLALGLPTVTSPQVAAELGARHGEHLLVAADQSEAAYACAELLANAHLRETLTLGARDFIERQHRLQPSTNALARLLAPAQPATHVAANEGLARAA